MASTSPDEPSGSWDSIHVFETAERGRQAHYKLTSTVMLELVTKQNSKAEETFVVGEQEKKASQQGWKSSGEVALSGSMTRQVGVSRYLVITYTFTLRRPNRTGPFTNRLHILRIQER
jgi:capping protein beta